MMEKENLSDIAEQIDKLYQEVQEMEEIATTRPEVTFNNWLNRQEKNVKELKDELQSSSTLERLKGVSVEASDPKRLKLAEIDNFLKHFKRKYIQSPYRSKHRLAGSHAQGQDEQIERDFSDLLRSKSTFRDGSLFKSTHRDARSRSPNTRSGAHLSLRTSQSPKRVLQPSKKENESSVALEQKLDKFYSDEIKMRSEIAALKDKLYRKKLKISSLKRSLKSSVGQVKSPLKSPVKDVKGDREKENIRQRKMKELEDENARLKQDLQQKEEVLSKQERLNLELSSQRDQLRSKAEDLKNTLKFFETRLRDDKSSHAELQSKLLRKKEKIMRLKQECTDLNYKVKSLPGEIQLKDKKIVELNDERKLFMREIEDLKSEIGQTSREIAVASDQSKRSESVIAQLEEELKKSNEAQEKLADRITELELLRKSDAQAYDELNSELSHAADTISSLGEAKRELERKLINLKDKEKEQNRIVDEKIGVFIQEFNKLKEANQALSERETALLGKLAAMDKDIIATKDTNRSLRALVKEMEEEIMRLEKKSLERR